MSCRTTACAEIQTHRGTEVPSPIFKKAMKKLITILLLLLMLSGCGSSFTPKATDQLTVILHAGGVYLDFPELIE